jgi:hypothetical protein
MPASAGNCGDVASSHVRASTRVGRSISAVSRCRSATVDTMSLAAEPFRTLAVICSGARTASCRYSSKGIPDRAETCSASASYPVFE